MSCRLTIGLGRRIAELHCADPACGELLRSRYQPFAVDGPPDLRIEYRVRGRSWWRGANADRIADARRRGMRSVRGQRDWQLAAAGARGRLSRDGRSLDLVGVRHSYPMDLALPHAWYALEPDGLLLHAAMLVVDGCAIVCVGDSGRGKSTLAALAGELAHCDELVAVTPTGSGFLAASLPFWRGRSGSAPLAEVLVLEHGLHSQRRALAPVPALAELARQVVWPSGRGRAEGVLRDLGRLARATPIARFPFRPDRSAIGALAE